MLGNADVDLLAKFNLKIARDFDVLQRICKQT